MFDEDDIREFLVVFFVTLGRSLVCLMRMARRHIHASLFLLPRTILCEDGDSCCFL